MMPSTATPFDAYVLKCWAEFALQQTAAREAIAAYLD